jgi:hypothetical protein
MPTFWRNLLPLSSALKINIRFIFSVHQITEHCIPEDYNLDTDRYTTLKLHSPYMSLKGALYLTSVNLLHMKIRFIFSVHQITEHCIPEDYNLDTDRYTTLKLHSPYMSLKAALYLTSVNLLHIKIRDCK